MKPRDKKMVKTLSVLLPVLLLAVWYGFGQIQSINKRKAEQQKRAAEQAAAAAQEAGGAVQPPGATPGTPQAPVAQPQPAVSANGNTATASTTISFTVDASAQAQRMQLPWRRDPFMPPDSVGPAITAPAKVEAVRGAPATTIKIQISDAATGNSGVRSAALFYGTKEPFDENRVDGTHEGADNGDGVWMFEVPALKGAVQCFVSARDGGPLKSESRSAVFPLAQPVLETAETRVGGTEIVLMLRGISWSGTSGVALINSEVCSEGDLVNGCKVVRIARDTVVLKRDDREIVLQLKE